MRQAQRTRTCSCWVLLSSHGKFGPTEERADNSEADEQQKPSSPANGMSHPGIASPTMHYAGPAQLGVGNVMGAQTAYPYPDPYYRSIFAPYETQPYPAQPYPSQPMVHLQLMGIQQAGVPLPSEAVEEPVFVNAKQYHGIMRRRQSRAKAELENKLAKSRKFGRVNLLHFSAW
ncbi:nuclear transcription factor Y subunit A-4-like isoform X7 [Sesamum indicum]|uniref:Nuclear transcription factor Y subunit n=1 Tax=Sesamum indicum TaxID=4182 RepID=A0A8M8VCR4_SESIN|nr:nuclear transcription factor Y subunit A-4-like isoform X7 [Sesamum indicum]